MEGVVWGSMKEGRQGEAVAGGAVFSRVCGLKGSKQSRGMFFNADRTAS